MMATRSNQQQKKRKPTINRAVQQKKERRGSGTKEGAGRQGRRKGNVGQRRYRMRSREEGVEQRGMLEQCMQREEGESHTTCNVPTSSVKSLGGMPVFDLFVEFPWYNFYTKLQERLVRTNLRNLFSVAHQPSQAL